ncbi:hypothetical protein BC830DRAFT_118345 [Chytriomyces sp. MP71]|nr:hypothetical protein BC830DRAFT_118345 [Chytriomyces sp. MP71]
MTTCTACFAKSSDITLFSCCSSSFCKDCLGTKCLDAIKSRATFPASCCREREIPLQQVRRILNKNDFQTYERLLRERASMKGACKRVDPEHQAVLTAHGFKMCPGCHAGVEKVGGCEHVKCIMCGTDFCVTCEKEYKGLRGLCGCKLPLPERRSCDFL